MCDVMLSGLSRGGRESLIGAMGGSDDGPLRKLVKGIEEEVTWVEVDGEVKVMDMISEGEPCWPLDMWEEPMDLPSG